MSNLCDQLNTLLATQVNFYFQYKYLHWHYQGNSFYQFHQLFDQHADKIYASQDIIAERIRQLNGKVQANLTSYENLSKFSVDEDILANDQNINQVLVKLEENHNLVIQLLEEIIGIASSRDDFSTADLLTSYLEQHQQMRWFIQSSQSKN